MWKKLVNIRDSCKRLRDDEDMELVTIVAGFIVVVAAVSYGQMYGQNDENIKVLQEKQ